MSDYAKEGIVFCVGIVVVVGLIYWFLFSLRADEIEQEEAQYEAIYEEGYRDGYSDAKNGDYNLEY